MKEKVFISKPIVDDPLLDRISKPALIAWFRCNSCLSCKTLQNRKWIMATSLPDNSLYELTYDGETGQFYLDEYVKVSNTVMNAVVPEDLV